jgi:putative ABC transport system permease protein
MILYRALLRLYPASFREEYGREMRAIFARRWRLASHAGERAMLLADALFDALRNAPAAHVDLVKGRTSTAAWQTIRRARVLSVTVVAVTAVGIGATTAAFAVADHVLIRPLPYHEPHRLVKIWQADLNGGRSERRPRTTATGAITPGRLSGWAHISGCRETSLALVRLCGSTARRSPANCLRRSA